MYNFKKETELYLVYNSVQYKLPIYSDVSVSQTYRETRKDVKTLHNKYGLVGDAIINGVNPVNFTFTTPAYVGTNHSILIELLTSVYLDNEYNAVQLRSFDLYLKLNSGIIYKIEGAILESGIIQIVKNDIVLFNLSGSSINMYTVDSIPGTPKSIPTFPEYLVPYFMQVEKDGLPVERIAGITLEFRNGINWNNNTTLHNILNGELSYSRRYTLVDRSFVGNIETYITEDNIDDVLSYSTDSSIEINVANSIDNYILKIYMPKVVYTNRLNMGDIFTQTYDFSLIDYSSSDYTTVLDYYSNLKDLGSNSMLIFAAI